MTVRFLIIGANGQLAGEFIKTFKDGGHDFAALDKEQLDITSGDNVLETVSRLAPEIVLNCAAYNLVDKAEEDYDRAYSINAVGVRNLASACHKNKSLLVHYSTDYVFDGTKEDFYTEDDEPNPVNIYGKSKLSGEKFLKDGTDNFLLFRVSWVFGRGKQNFLYKLSEWADKNRVLKIVYDQVSVPTYTADIVKGTMLALNKGLKGLYNLTNNGYCSRYEVARYFLEKLGRDNLILPVSSDYFPLPAKRPYFSKMSNNKLSNDLGIVIPEWRSGIDRYAAAISADKL